MKVLITLAVLAIASTQPSAVAQVVFGPSVSSSVGPGSLLRVADFDGDGNLDVLRNQLGATSLHLGDGSGHFGAAVATQPQLQVTDADVGDVNGDGRPDIVALRSLPNSTEFYVLLGLGGAAFDFTDLQTLSSSASPLLSVRLADADSDSDLDALVKEGTVLEPKLLLFRNDAAGHFTQQLVTTNPVPAKPFAADLNGDGRPDVVATTGSANSIIFGQAFVDVLLGQADGSFLSVATWPHAMALEVVDLDLDGELDVLTAELGAMTTPVRAHLGQGDGQFLDGPLTPLAHTGFLPDQRPVADFDGDGVPDLLVRIGPPPTHETVLLGDGRGGFGPDETVKFDWALSDTFVLADVVPDGRPDIVKDLGTTALSTWPNLTYAADGPLLDLGHANQGFFGWPILLVTGDFAGNDAAEFQIFGLGFDPTFLVAGLTEGFAAFHGGTLVPAPDFVLGPLSSAPDGSLELKGRWPAGVPSGATLTVQFWSATPGTPANFYGASSAVRITAP